MRRREEEKTNDGDEEMSEYHTVRSYFALVP